MDERHEDVVAERCQRFSVGPAYGTVTFRSVVSWFCFFFFLHFCIIAFLHLFFSFFFFISPSISYLLMGYGRMDNWAGLMIEGAGCCGVFIFIFVFVFVFVLLSLIFYLLSYPVFLVGWGLTCVYFYNYSPK